MEFFLGILLLFGWGILKVLWEIFANSRGKEKNSSPPRETPKSFDKPTPQTKMTHVAQQPSPIVREKVSDFSTPHPGIPSVIPDPFDYNAQWWKDYSLWYRVQRSWTCESCQISLYDDQQYLHTHHRWGTRYNDPDDLQALCIACHAEQPGSGHQRLRDEQHYHEFINKYGPEWRLRR